MANRKTSLTEKHWKALGLIEKGELNIGEICREMEWDEKYFYDLRNGNIEKAGYIAELFSKECKRIEEKRDISIKKLVKINTESAQELIQRTLSGLKSKGRLSLEEKKLVCTLTNALAKCTPSVSIGSLSYNYTKGLTPEELIHEFKRLKTIAEQSFNRGGVSEPESGGSGDLSEVDE